MRISHQSSRASECFLLMNKLGKYGLTGDSGLVGDVHLNACYDANGKVFVDLHGHWKRTTLKQAKRYGWQVIPCAQCDKPAVSLDHLYPYHAENNKCRKHYAMDKRTSGRV